MKRPNKTGEHLDGPGVAEDVFDIWNIHTELVAETFLDIEGDFSQDAMNLGNPLVGHSDLRQIRVLEEAIIGLFLLNS